jgi:hypothetical protein
MAENPDYTQAGDVFRKAMEEALAHLDVVKAELKVEHDKAIDMQKAAQDEYNRILWEADKTAEKQIELRHKEYLEQVREKVWSDTLEKLIAAEIPSDMLKKILEIPAKLLADVWFRLGFDKLDEKHVGNVGYQNEGRSGYVIFYRNDLTVRFYFEFGGGDAVAIITVPSADRWEAETKIALADRMTVLEFIAKRAIRDQAPDCKYLIGESDIIIMRT